MWKENQKDGWDSNEILAIFTKKIIFNGMADKCVCHNVM